MELNPIISNESNQQAKTFFAKHSGQTKIIQTDNKGINTIALKIKVNNNAIIIESIGEPKITLPALKEILGNKFADKIISSVPTGNTITGFSIYLPILPSKEWKIFLKNKQVVFNPLKKVNKNGDKIQNIYILDPNPILVGFRSLNK